MVAVRCRHYALTAMLFAALLIACGGPEEIQIAGRTMGTTYLVKIVARGRIDLAGLKQRIDERLESINHSMSTYRADSDISRFNTVASAGVPVAVSPDFIAVLKVARELHDITGGAWDGTIKPVIHLWGFGNTNRPKAVPSPEAIAAALVKTGFEHIRVHDGAAIAKTLPGLTLDLASIAKGYGVDAVTDTLRREGFSDFLVEIGGEVFAAGFRKDGQPWRVGVNFPAPDAPADQVFRAVPISNHALATSGDYRNYFIQQGQRYSHIIDPRTGRPVTHGVVSVSIYAPNCTLADGLATGIMVMGAEAGLALLETLPSVEGFIIEAAADGGFIASATPGFPGETRTR